MKIRMLEQMSGTRDGEPWPALDEVAELPTAIAAHYVASGIAERVDDAPAVDEPAPPRRRRPRPASNDNEAGAP